VEVALHHNGCDLEICVADRGAGVPAFERDRIFEMYATAHERGSRGSRHGLGLAYCRAVVESHGGTIKHRDNAPQGSRFVITIPAPGTGSAVEAELAADEARG
jgi:two-component system sensor histidine kinase KdpD